MGVEPFDGVAIESIPYREVSTKWWPPACTNWTRVQRSLCIVMVLLVFPVGFLAFRATPILLRELAPLPGEVRVFEEDGVTVQVSDLDVWCTSGDVQMGDDVWINTVELKDCTVRLSSRRLIVAQLVGRTEKYVRFVIAVPDEGGTPTLEAIRGQPATARSLLKGDLEFIRSAEGSEIGVAVLKLGAFARERDMQLRIPTTSMSRFEKAFEYALSGQGREVSAPPAATPPVPAAAPAEAAAATAAAAAATNAPTAASADSSATELKWRCNCPPSFAVVACTKVEHRAIVSGSACPFYAEAHRAAAAEIEGPAN